MSTLNSCFSFEKYAGIDYRLQYVNRLQNINNQLNVGTYIYLFINLFILLTSIYSFLHEDDNLSAEMVLSTGLQKIVLK